MSRRTASPAPDALAAPLEEIARRAVEGRATVGGLYGSARALALSELARGRPVLAVVPDLLDAEGIEDDVKTLVPRTRTLLLRPLESDDVEDPDARAELSERLTHLRRIGRLGPGTVAVVPAAVLLEPLPTREDVGGRRLVLRPGDEVDLPRLRALLLEAGYTVVPMVGAPAELSVRGDIVDLYPLGEREPVRVELFDDAVESIRTFDLESQRSTGTRNEVAVPLVTPAELRRAEARSLLIDHLDGRTLTVRVDPRRVRERLEEVAVARDVERPIVRRTRAWLDEASGVDLVGDTVDDDERSRNVRTLSVQGLGGGVDELDRSLATLRRSSPEVVVFAESDGELRRIGKVLRDKGLLDGGLTLRKGRLRTGFQLVDAGRAYLNHLELLGKPRLVRPRPRRPSVPAKAIQNLLELTPGDHVVHVTHGIARYEGTTRMKRDLGEEEFLILAFDGGTTFYLPTSKIDLVQRYVGAGGAPPRLDRIGGKSWSNKRARVKKALEEIADELLEVQAAREVRVGPPHPMDDPLIDDFEASFPYQDTPDQRRAMKAIHDDLGGPRPMDRLLCGDVGFGKTELAVRAAFRVVCGGRQAAVLVPTTLLAEQHTRTFQERLAPYPVRIEALSRFRSRKAQKEVVEGLIGGAVDVVVGTHRLLSKDVRFKDLGLVVVDEEQRFGVKAKEALKRLRRSVDVLTLTATPIPRTLHMALVGLRDISSLDTPPPGRRPVRTEIRRFDDEVIRRAILHELARGGQVFFVHNRITALERLAVHVGDLVPNARIAVAHGRMPERELEETTRRFAAGEADLLLSTSIVESGLDLPHANTMLIDRPDLFGLADLHQLRGRVGRSDRQAYCTLLVPPKPLPDVSEKRLKAVEELSHLGAGYDIAIKDLEIRGAGNLLGATQSGHIAAVGYDLFVQLLRRAVAESQGKRPPPEPVETDVDVGVEAFLPAEYVEDAGQRMELLRRLGGAEGPPLPEMLAELKDRFGTPPPVARNLTVLFALKRRCRELGVRRVLYPGGDHVLLELQNARRFQKAAPFPPGRLIPMAEALVHWRLEEDERAPQRVLDALEALLLGG